MTAYAIIRVTVTDPVAYEAYKTAAAASIAAAGGRYLARGGATETLEGPQETQRLVVLEWPDMAAARAWFDGPAYRAARDLRQHAAQMQFVLVDGI